MSVRTRIIFLLLFSFVTLASLAAQSNEPDPDVVWYESFFDENNRKSVDDELQSTTTSLEEAIETRDWSNEVRYLKEIGLIHLVRTKDYDKAMDVLIKALAIEDSLNLKDKQVFTYLAIASVFREVGNFVKSEQYLEEASRLNERFKNINILVLILNERGKTSAADGKIEKAFENYEQVLEYKDDVGDPRVEAEALFNIAYLHSRQGKSEEALKNHKLALSIRRKIHDRANEAASLNAVGELYLGMKNYDRALANHVAALAIRRALKDKDAVAESYNNIGVLYHHQKNYKRAIANLQLGLKAALESHSQIQELRSYEYLGLGYNEVGDYKKALEYKSLFVALNELLLNDKNEQKLVERQNRYVIDKKETQIDELEVDKEKKTKEIQEQKQFRNILIVFIALILVIVALIFYLYIQKQRSNKVLKEANDKVQLQNIELQNLNATKDKFFSIISHDLKGPLNSLTSFSGLLINHTESLSKEEIQMLAKDLDKSIKNLFALLENLLEWSRSQTGNIEFKPEGFDMVSLLEENQELLNAQAGHKKIKIVSETADPVFVVAHRNSVNTVVRNLISNAIKFTPEGGTVTLRSHKSKKDLIVSIADTGVGMTKEIISKLFRIETKHSTKGTANEKGTGLGLILCKDFIEKNGGQILVESEAGKGSVFSFSLPLAVEQKPNATVDVKTINDASTK